MNIFITGASGFIGGNLTRKLLAENHKLNVLIRDSSKAGEFYSAGIKVIQGDLSDREILKTGMNDCDWVFHLAAYTRPVSKDPGLPYSTNVTGSINILEAAREQSVKKVIITSSAGTLGYSGNGAAVTEASGENPVYHTEYERTKALSEQDALSFGSEYTDVIVVNPTRVYGPGKLTISNSVTRIIKLYGTGFWRIIPGDGKAIGNYVFIDDVVNGLILAARNGKGGERYILGGENISYIELFNILGDLYECRRKLFTLNESSLKRIAGIAAAFSKLTNRPAVISKEWIDKYLQNWIVSSEKAKSYLDYKITPFREGAAKTISWLRSGKQFRI